jgi:hypothetical protein
MGTGCSFLVAPSAQQCRSDSDCELRGAAFAGSTCVDNLCLLPSPPDADVPEVALPPGWECVGNTRQPPVTKPQVQLTVTVSDLFQPARTINDAVVVRICRRLDVSCASPVSAAFHPDLMGHAQFMVDAGFDGYVEVLPAVDPPQYAPTLIFFSQPLNDDLVNPSTQLLPLAELPGLVMATGGGTMLDATLGAVFFRAANCSRTPAKEIMFSVDLMAPETHRFYTVGGFPTQMTMWTDPSGLGGFINLPTGIRAITGTRQADGLVVATTAVLVRPGYFTYGLLAPLPFPPTPSSP